jgi:hypothetical protein
LAKSAAHVEGVSRSTLLAAITPSCAFSSKGTSRGASSWPPLSLTPTEPVWRLIGRLTSILSKARRAYAVGSVGGRGP